MPKSNMPGSMSAEKINDIPIDQRPDISGDNNEREPAIVKADADALAKKEWLDDLAFMEEPVKIRIEPSSEKNAPAWFPSSVNGQWAEVLQPNGTWRTQMEGYLPVGIPVTTKRKYLENILRAKVDIINIEGTDGHAVDMGVANRVRTQTTAVHGVSILHDPSPARGQQWVEECRRRYF